jgi:hypothetical protein
MRVARDATACATARRAREGVDEDESAIRSIDRANRDVDRSMRASRGAVNASSSSRNEGEKANDGSFSR